MPSFLISNRSGGDTLWSGALYSGSPAPVGGIQLYLDPSASGNAYIGLSGGMTIRSGGLWGSGALGGMLDGMLVPPGGNYFIPKEGLVKLSGNVNVYVSADAAASGQARLYFEVF